MNQRLLRLWIAHRVSVRVDANGRRAERGARRDQKRREVAASAADDEEVLRRQTQRWLRGDGRMTARPSAAGDNHRQDQRPGPAWQLPFTMGRRRASVIAPVDVLTDL